ncbi:hypothetical protein SprV_0501936200 [Sparganum proliferum]
MCVVLLNATAARAAVVGAVEEEEEDEGNEVEEQEEEGEDGSGGSEEQSELVGGGDDKEEAGGGTTFGAVREVRLIRRYPISPIRAQNVRWHRGHVESGCASALRTRRTCDLRALRFTLAAAMRLAS